MTDDAMGRPCPVSRAKWLNIGLRKLAQRPKKIARDYVKPGDTVLDFGCGGGFFAVELADMVGPKGRVIAVDVQEEMLVIARDFARKHGVEERITFHHSEPSDLGLPGEQADFVLAFYVVHEVPDRKRVLGQIAETLRPDGRFMLVEPVGHVSGTHFRQILQDAEAAGLTAKQPIRRLLSRGMLFGPPAS